MATEFKTGRKMSDGFNKGENNPMYGRTGASNHMWRGGMPFCLDCGKQLSDRRCQRCVLCYQDYVRDRNKATGVGWKTKLNRQIRHCEKYYEWRETVFERDNFTCRICGVRNKRGLGRTVRMEVDHHPISMSSIMQDYDIKDMKSAIGCDVMWDTDNGRVLCIDCHNETKWGRPKNETST